MGHKLDEWDIKELRDNVYDFDDLVFVVSCMVRRAYDSGYEEGYNASKEDE